MTHNQLLAQAAEADRQADVLFATIGAVGAKAPADHRGLRPLIPAGFEGRAQNASDLRRQAERLRAEAAELAPPKVPASVPLALTPPPSPTICPAAAATPPEPAPDPVEVLVARIMKA